ncbi:MAG: 5'/3'-nucleotidase SurE [Myxococcales bacterium]|jgi:5'-nucleotidase|nr:5'/3'-nucleotidase SurE [Myxococcales bacterium]
MRRILLTNDDGFAAPGLRAFADALTCLPDVEVTVVAPSLEQSAKSHAITLHTPMRIHEHAPRWFHVDGTPSDCAFIGINHILRDAPPDLVCSGINHGPNVGSDVLYSGTVAAAMEAALIGTRGVAFSLVRGKDFETAARRGARIVRALLDRPLSPGVVLNVNLPETAGSTGDAIAITRLGRRSYGSAVVERLDPRGKPYVWIGGFEANYERAGGTDCEAVFIEGKTSITPLTLDCTANDALPLLNDWIDSSELSDSSDLSEARGA